MESSLGRHIPRDFEKYLALKPGAADTERIKEYLAELARRN